MYRLVLAALGIFFGALALGTVTPTPASVLGEKPKWADKCPTEASCAEAFRAAGKSIPVRLVELGFEEFGRLDLKTFIKDIDSVRITPKEWLKVYQSDGTERISAYWHRNGEGQGIDFNLLAWAATPQRVEALVALHEFLNFFDYDDHNYNLSVSLWFFLDQLNRPIISSDFQDDVEERIIQLAGGGAVGVGGGGDLAGPFLKLSMIEVAEEDAEKLSDAEEKSNKVMTGYLTAMAAQIEAVWKVNE